MVSRHVFLKRHSIKQLMIFVNVSDWGLLLTDGQLICLEKQHAHAKSRSKWWNCVFYFVFYDHTLFWAYSKVFTSGRCETTYKQKHINHFMYNNAKHFHFDKAAVLNSKYLYRFTPYSISQCILPVNYQVTILLE